MLYYIDKSVLVENRPLIKLRRVPGLEWHIFHILLSEDNDYAISVFETVVCANILLSIYLRKLHDGLKI